MNNKLPLNLNFDLNISQQGALEAKNAIIQLRDKLNEIAYEGEYDDYKPLLLEHRSQIISEVITNLGNFGDQQNGFIAALLEYIEILTSGYLAPEEWQPSAISGEWQ